MNVVGRVAEIALMEDLLLSKQPEFLAMYGRRRIGKTFLIKEVYAANIVFDCSGLHEKDLAQQLENFWLNLCAKDKKLLNKPMPSSWLLAFQYLKDWLAKQKGKKKKVIFLDEISWFDTPRSGFLAALDVFWNQYCTKRSDIILAICGSAASWIINKVINNRGGLHNRVTQKILLQPFTLGETKLYLESLQVALIPKDIIQLYMCTGGVPFYLSKIKKGKSLEQILNGLFFEKNGLLLNEFDNLYASLFKNHYHHIAIVKALASKQCGLTRAEIMKQTGLKSGGGFTTLLNELLACGFISEIFPLKKNKEEFVFRLTDEYTYFYFKFIEKYKPSTNWMATQVYKIWCGYAFENVCLKHIAQIKKALGISGVGSYNASWLFKGTKEEAGTQIDLLIDRADNCINICEAKFYDAPFEITKNYEAILRQKVGIFKDKAKVRKNVFVTMISPFGVKKNAYALSIVSNEIVAEDFFV